VQYDFAGGDADFKDFYMGLKKIPYAGTLKIGHFKEPFSLEELTSSKYITFMERSLPNALAPGRNMGFALTNTFMEDQIWASVGMFKETDGYAEAENEGQWAVSARVAGQPWYANKGEQCVHLGLGLSYRSNPDNDYGVESEPECHGASDFVGFELDGTADSTLLIGPEVAVVYGPFSAQAEYVISQVDARGTGVDDASFSGWYAYLSFFVTGERRAYKQSKAAFDRVKPKENFSLDEGGVGALELAVRYSQLDLTDEQVYGGELGDISAGVNWYLNPNTRIMMNYVHASYDDKRNLPSYEGDANIFMMRFQVDF
jgi:phosphate-selective porin OprO/OprP